MSKLTELFKTIGTHLHLPELTKPLWETTIAAVDDHETRLAKLEGSSPASLAPGLIRQLTVDWEMYEQNVARRRQQDAVDAEERAKAAADAAAAIDAQVKAQAEADALAAATAAGNPSGAAASNAVPSPAALPEAAVAGDHEPTALELGAAVRAAGEPPLIDLAAHTTTAADSNI